MYTCRKSLHPFLACCNLYVSTYKKKENFHGFHNFIVSAHTSHLFESCSLCHLYKFIEAGRGGVLPGAWFLNSLYIINLAGMGIKEDVESDVQEGVRVPLMAEGDEAAGGSGGGNLWMVYLSTFVAVCGSYEFGSCVSA